MATITFHELDPVPWFRQRRLMKACLLEMFSKEKVPVGSIDFIFCNDEYLLQINQQFLQHDDFTDIITFDLTESSGSSFVPGESFSKESGEDMVASLRKGDKGSGPRGIKEHGSEASARKLSKAGKGIAPKQGEIYISIERVQENAALLSVSREEELRRVMFHGCLHLCGYKDKLNDQKALMRRMEDKYLRLYNLRST